MCSCCVFAIDSCNIIVSLSLHTHLHTTGSNVSQIACRIYDLAMAPSLLEVPATLWHPHCLEAAPFLAVLSLTTTAQLMVQRDPRLAILTIHYLQRWATFGAMTRFCHLYTLHSVAMALSADIKDHPYNERNKTFTN